MHDCEINNYHGLCGSEGSMFTTDVAIRDDDDDAQVEDLRRLELFDHRCLRNVAVVGWCQRIRNET